MVMSRERSAHIWIDMGRASNAEKQPTGRGPEGCVENGRRLRCSSVTYQFGMSEKGVIKSAISLYFGRSGTAGTATRFGVIGRVTKAEHPIFRRPKFFQG